MTACNTPPPTLTPAPAPAPAPTSTLRINLFGAPCAGKSKTAAWLYDALSLAHPGLALELVREVVKPDAYLGTTIGPWKSFSILAWQLEAEREFLEAGVPRLVTDAPVWLNCYYLERTGHPTVAAACAIARAWDRIHTPLNIYLTRPPGVPYEQAGRFHTEAQADAIAVEQAAFLRRHDVTYQVIANRMGLFSYVTDYLRRTHVLPESPASMRWCDNSCE